MITPYHPVKKTEWVFPNTLNKTITVDCEYMYNYVLENIILLLLAILNVLHLDMDLLITM